MVERFKPESAKRFRIPQTALAAVRSDERPPLRAFELPTYAPGVLPVRADGKTPAMAHDSGTMWGGSNSSLFNWATSGAWQEGIGFMGYPYLAELTQRPEYRIPSEVLAEEMTRMWVRFTATSKDASDDKTEKLKEIEAEFDRLHIRQAFRSATVLDGFFGLSLLQFDLGTNENPDELRTPLSLRKEKIRPGAFRGLRVVDPTWIAPNVYNSINPLAADFYRPTSWFLMGLEVHSTRLLPIVSRPVPDILKPAYNFGGLSLSQMMKPYVDNWLRTRQSVSDLINAFTTFVLSTNMQATIQDNGADGLINRMAFFNAARNNRGILLVDKETEQLDNVSAPLGSLDHLQAQAQEHMCAVSRLPLVKAFGITPSGLNATSEGEIRVFYDTIRAAQEFLYTDPLRTVLKVVQLSLYGEIDPEIGFDFVPLYQLDEAGLAAVRKMNADTDAVLIESNVITTDEARRRLSAEEASPYAGLEGPAPEPPEPMPGEGEADIPGLNADPAERIAAGGAGGSMTGANAGA